MSRPAIIATYWFASSSGSGTHETLAYADGTTSCSCHGWCRRIDSSGHRSCKHTRMVEAGIARRHATSYRNHDEPPQISNQQSSIPNQQSRPARGHKPAPPGQRKIIIT